MSLQPVMVAVRFGLNRSLMTSHCESQTYNDFIIGFVTQYTNTSIRRTDDGWTDVEMLYQYRVIKTCLHNNNILQY